MNLDDTEYQIQKAELELQYEEHFYTELHRDEPSPFCPKCEEHDSKCNCIVYGRKLYPEPNNKYDWQTRLKPSYKEDYIEIMNWQDWCGEQGDKWRKENIPEDKTKLVKVKDIVLPSGFVVEEWEFVNEQE